MRKTIIEFVNENELVDINGYFNWHDFDISFSDYLEYNDFEIFPSGVHVNGKKLFDLNMLSSSRVYYEKTSPYRWTFIIRCVDGMYVYFCASYDNELKHITGEISLARNWMAFWNECLDDFGKSVLHPVTYDGEIKYAS